MKIITIIEDKSPDDYPESLVNAVYWQRLNYPEIVNTGGDSTHNYPFDRLFEEINKGAEIKYNPNRIVWANDKDYTMFLLKWAGNESHTS